MRTERARSLAVEQLYLFTDIIEQDKRPGTRKIEIAALSLTHYYTIQHWYEMNLVKRIKT